MSSVYIYKYIYILLFKSLFHLTTCSNRLLTQWHTLASPINALFRLHQRSKSDSYDFLRLPGVLTRTCDLRQLQKIYGKWLQPFHTELRVLNYIVSNVIMIYKLVVDMAFQKTEELRVRIFAQHGIVHLPELIKERPIILCLHFLNIKLLCSFCFRITWHFF